MSAPQNFRSAFNGFNREDVVRYLEYINSKHTAQINQLNSEIDFLRAKLETATQPDADLAQEREALMERTAQLEARCAELEQQLAQKQEQPAQEVPAPKAAESTPAPATNDELEAYRRAERTERLARERAELIYHQVNGVLAEATVKVDGIAGEIGTMADQVIAQLTQLQSAVSGSKQALQDAASIMYTIKPNN